MSALVVDSHCHLDYEGLTERLPQVVADARTAGVGLMLSISTKVAKLPGLLAIAETNPEVYCTVGTHPHVAHEELDVTVADLVRLSNHPKVVGLGEAGLDYHYNLSSVEAQKQGFSNHIAAAQQTGLPLVIHAREADTDVERILTENTSIRPFNFVLHCFTSSLELARAGVALGGYVSFSGILTYKTAENLRAVAATVPADRLLVETDSPYLAPVPHRGKKNEPAFVMETLKVLAQVKGLSTDEMAKVTSDNFFRLFSKVQRPEGWH